MMYRLLTLLALILIGVAGWLTLQHAPAIVGPPATRSPLPEPGYTATDAHLMETGPDGLPMYSLVARTIRQQPRSTLVLLDEVRMQFHDQEGGNWNARADHGSVESDSSEVQLSGRVDVMGTFAGTDQPAHIMTDTLTVDTRADIIRTPAPVELDWEGKIVQARGLYAALKTHHVRLEAAVHGHFEP
jgi:LPS export ABC transporter protein LptC